MTFLKIKKIFFYVGYNRDFSDFVKFWQNLTNFDTFWHLGNFGKFFVTKLRSFPGNTRKFRRFLWFSIFCDFSLKTGRSTYVFGHFFECQNFVKILWKFVTFCVSGKHDFDPFFDPQNLKYRVRICEFLIIFTPCTKSILSHLMSL